MLPHELTYLDLFSGTGGFALGLKRAGFKFKKHYFSEIDQYAIANYQYNFKNAEYVGAIEKINIQRIERPNIITFGSPCQDISVASAWGKGLSGGRSKLFFDAIKTIKRLKPDCFIFENVRNLFSSNKGKDFETVLRSISEIGLYDCQWQLLNSSLVLPQHRERIYLVGHLSKKTAPKIFPIKIDSKKVGEVQEKKKLIQIGKVYKSRQTGKIYDASGKSPAVLTDGLTFFIRSGKDIRKITPIEAERLQGFPDEWTKQGVSDGQPYELSDTQRYQLLGNAVSPDLVSIIADHLKKTNALSGLHQMKNKDHNQFLEEVLNSLRNGEAPSRIQLEKRGREFGLSDKREVKEYTELAILIRARELKTADPHDTFSNLVNLYKSQPHSSYRSTDVIKLRQYSTPLPISFLLGRFVYSTFKDAKYLEPSAGNGLLTIGLPPGSIQVNEIDKLRLNSLKKGKFGAVTNFDASLPMQSLYRKFDGVISNPPFGRFEQSLKYNGFDVYFRDHYMVLTALETMKDNGKAAFVMGTHLRFASKGRIAITAGRAFFSYVYANYNVVDLIPIDGNKLYARQGTGFDVSLLLINGRKKTPKPVALTKDSYDEDVIYDYPTLYNRISKHFNMTGQKDYKALASALVATFRKDLGAAYIPTSQSCNILNTQVPDTMAFEIHEALKKIRKAVGGDIDNFVRHRLGYTTKTELCKVLSAEQIDAVALAIYNIEAKDQGCIIGDQTGIGKGRVAAAVLRYAVQQGYTPIFLTERVNLFSDIYRDLKAIESGHLHPFIVNSRDSLGKTNIKDENGKTIYKPPTKGVQQNILRSGELKEYDIVLATYSQFNASEKSLKQDFLKEVAKNQIIVCDESHNASGESNTGTFLKDVVANSKSTIFSSATFAKRPENLPIYAIKTAISDANMTPDELISAIKKGGVALQEIIASQLVSEGQMIRRERSYDGVKVGYKILEEKKAEHFAMADNITAIMRDIIAFQDNYIKPLIEEIDDELSKQNEEIRQRGGTSNLGVSNQSYFSKAFNIINQMLFAIKAESVAETAIRQLKAGKKPIIAFSSTMGSFLNQLATEEGISVGEGEKIQTDFALILKNGLNGIMRYTKVDKMGKSSHESFSVSDISLEGQAEYFKILGHIEDASTGLFISPIDVILEKIRNAGFSAEEVTGRNTRIQYDPGYKTGIIEKREKVNVNDAFNAFNNNELDVLLINQSGSTGASAQAMITNKVPRHEVKPRVMIVLQMELNIDTEIQKRGRIHRTGQIHLPEYIYVNSAIPAEKRMMMMLRMKLKSLDANTSSNQNQNQKMIDVPDYLNKYGDRIVSDYIREKPSLYASLGYPNLNGSGGAIAHAVTGRIAVMPTGVQEDFYAEIVKRYIEYIDLVKQTGEYDLEVEELNLEAKTISKRISVVGRGGTSLFGTDTYLEKVEANVLKKPFTRDDLKRMIGETLGNVSPETYRDRLLENFDQYVKPNYLRDVDSLESKFNQQLEELRVNKTLWKIHEKHGEKAYEDALQERKEKIELDYNSRRKALENAFKSQKDSFTGLVKFFTVGRQLSYSFSSFLEPSFAVFLGFDINSNNKNPFAPSNVKLRFAIASSLKYLVFPMSYREEINAIRGASMDLPQMELSQVYREWEERVKDQQKDRTIRYLKSGNLLQGVLDGKLVSYTTDEGNVKKGILLPEHVEMKFEQQGVVVPLSRALPIFESMRLGHPLPLSNELTITKREDHLELRTPASKKKGGKFYLNERLIKLTRDNKFEKVGNVMKGEIPLGRLESLLDQLDQLSVNINLTLSEFQKLDEQTAKKLGRKRKIKRPPKEEVENTKLKLMRMRAKALKLKMTMISYKNNAA